MLKQKTKLIRAFLSLLFCGLCSMTPGFAAEFADNDSANQISKEIFDKSFHKACQLIKDNSMFPERLKNWSKWQHKFDGKINSEAALENALKQVLAELGDQYTFFRNATETRQRLKRDHEESIVSSRRLSNNVAYLAIRSFSSFHTSSELESALQMQSDAEAYIIDLRANGGGYVEQALSSFELMCDQGRFVSMKGREDAKPYSEDLILEKDGLRRVLNDITIVEERKQNLCGNKSMLVLVDGDTRSAAEMLAGALRDSRQARLIGSRTFGKGVIQCGWNLDPGCSLNVAMAKYFLPSGLDINGKGIAPDVYMNFQTEAKDANFATARDFQFSLKELEKYLPESYSLPKLEISRTFACELRPGFVSEEN
ncbi:MAG: S41 family peptidase [Candidatus Obscuribacterales bacterium]|nr:S41 family peptidase [Candidatus Obscuribacterales bacterium]